MDRIEVYVDGVFAKFKDSPEIRAQKEEMSDHLRDRLRDAVSQGKSEKEAFEAVTADLSESMADLEQSLAEYLRDEYRQRPAKLPEPKTKEIPINLFRYHGALLTLFLETLILLVVLLCVGFTLFPIPGITPGLAASFNVEGLLLCLVLAASFHFVVSMIRYAFRPMKMKTVRTGPLGLLATIPFLETGVIALGLTFWLFMLDPLVDPLMFVALIAAWLLILHFLESVWIRLLNRKRYENDLPLPQELPLLKSLLVLLALIFPVVLHQAFSYAHGIADSRSAYESMDRERAAHRESYDNIFKLRQKEKTNHWEHARVQDAALKREKELYTGAPGKGKMGLDDGLPYEGLVIPFYTEEQKAKFMEWMRKFEERKREFEERGTAPGVGPPEPKRYATESIKMRNGLEAGSVVTLYRSKELQNEISWMPPATSDRSEWRVVKTSDYLKIPRWCSTVEEAKAAMEAVESLSEHTLSVFSTFPTAGSLEERPICAMNFPFEEYPLAKIEADAKLFTKDDGPYAGSITMKVGIANYCQRPQKMLLTVEYEGDLVNEDIPSGSTLYLAFFGRYEYREYMVNGFGLKDRETQEEYEVKFTLRNEWGQVLATTTGKVTTNLAAGSP